jgi:hypothetical protein
VFDFILVIIDIPVDFIEHHRVSGAQVSGAQASSSFSSSLPLSIYTSLTMSTT